MGNFHQTCRLREYIWGKRVPATLTSIFINDGLSDIETNMNPSGVARNLLSLILSYRHYRKPHYAIDAGFIPTEDLDYDSDDTRNDRFVHYRGINYDLDYAMYISARRNNKQQLDYYISLLWKQKRFPFDMFKHQNYALILSRYAREAILRGAARGGHKELIEFALKYTATNYDEGIREAIYGNHDEIVKFFVTIGTTDLDEGMGLSIKLNKRALIDFFLEKGASHWNYYTVCAIEYKNEELEQFFRSKGVNEYKINRALRIINKPDSFVRVMGLYTIKHLV